MSPQTVIRGGTVEGASPVGDALTLGPVWVLHDTNVHPCSDDEQYGRTVLAGTMLVVEAIATGHAGAPIEPGIGPVVAWLGDHDVVLSADTDPHRRTPGEVLTADRPTGHTAHGMTRAQWERLPAYARARMERMAQVRDEALARASRARERLAGDHSLAVLDPVADHLELPANSIGRVTVEFRDGTGGGIEVSSWPGRTEDDRRTIRVRAAQGDRLVVLPRDSSQVEVEVTDR